MPSTTLELLHLRSNGDLPTLKEVLSTTSSDPDIIQTLVTEVIKNNNAEIARCLLSALDALGRDTAKPRVPSDIACSTEESRKTHHPIRSIDERDDPILGSRLPTQKMKYTRQRIRPEEEAVWFKGFFVYEKSEDEEDGARKLANHDHVVKAAAGNAK
ncbi:MAG: hypothetical protein Q9187_003534 [Circinaria calcarea]